MKPEDRLLQMIYAVQRSQGTEIERQVFDLTIDYIYEGARKASQQEGLTDSKKAELVEKAESLANLFLWLRGTFESNLSGIAKDIVYGSLAAVLVTLSGIPLNVELSPALRRAAQEQQGLNAGKTRLLKHVMPRQAALHAAITVQEEESALAPSIRAVLI